MLSGDGLGVSTPVVGSGSCAEDLSTFYLILFLKQSTCSLARHLFPAIHCIPEAPLFKSYLSGVERASVFPGLISWIWPFFAKPSPHSSSLSSHLSWSPFLLILTSVGMLLFNISAHNLIFPACSFVPIYYIIMMTL